MHEAYKTFEKQKYRIIETIVSIIKKLKFQLKNSTNLMLKIELIKMYYKEQN